MKLTELRARLRAGKQLSTSHVEGRHEYSKEQGWYIGQDRGEDEGTADSFRFAWDGERFKEELEAEHARPRGDTFPPARFPAHSTIPGPMPPGWREIVRGEVGGPPTVSARERLAAVDEMERFRESWSAASGETLDKERLAHLVETFKRAVKRVRDFCKSFSDKVAMWIRSDLPTAAYRSRERGRWPSQSELPTAIVPRAVHPHIIIGPSYPTGADPPWVGGGGSYY